MRVASFAAAALVVVACGGGGDAAPAANSTSTDSTSLSGAAEDAGTPAGELETDVAVTVSKEQFDELRLRVLELAVEVDKLQSAAGLTPDGEEPDQDGDAGSGDLSDGDETAAWSYADADSWGDLAPEYRTCSDGGQQSPIDLTGAVGRDIPNAVLDSAPTDATITDDGRTLRVNVPDGATLELGGKVHSLVRFDVHAPSEHTVEGVHWPMELQFVHRADDGSLALLGVLVEAGASWPAFDVIIDSLPTRRDVTDIVYGDIDVADFLPELTAAFRYEGSLTSPPCTEGVSWSLLQGTITMSPAQMESITGRFDEPNNRPVQPTNGRILEKDLSA